MFIDTMSVSYAGLSRVILRNQRVCCTVAFELLSCISKNGIMPGKE